MLCPSPPLPESLLCKTLFLKVQSPKFPKEWAWRVGWGRGEQEGKGSLMTSSLPWQSPFSEFRKINYPTLCRPRMEHWPRPHSRKIRKRTGRFLLSPPCNSLTVLQPRPFPLPEPRTNLQQGKSLAQVSQTFFNWNAHVHIGPFASHLSWDATAI